mmetsp:Transcript_22530/g.64914  ORF Transcript_22530/g.64914 Transcript_22530/m.64914 type:complete len:239 (-) Transcript_22530:434-1150(-)
MTPAREKALQTVSASLRRALNACQKCMAFPTGCSRSRCPLSLRTQRTVGVAIRTLSRMPLVRLRRRCRRSPPRYQRQSLRSPAMVMTRTCYPCPAAGLSPLRRGQQPLLVPHLPQQVQLLARGRAPPRPGAAPPGPRCAGRASEARSAFRPPHGASRRCPLGQRPPCRAGRATRGGMRVERYVRGWRRSVSWPPSGLFASRRPWRPRGPTMRRSSQGRRWRRQTGRRCCRPSTTTARS